MTAFTTKSLPPKPDYAAPDGSEVRLLPELARGGLAHFTLPAGATSHAVVHKTVEEIWYIVSGRGEMWRKAGAQEEIVILSAGSALTIPVGTHFQFRTIGNEPLTAVAVTMPPWPGPNEAVPVTGTWSAASST